MNRIVLITTTRCNKKCEYCDIPKLKDPNDFKYNNYLNWISSNFREVEFSGGEIGMMTYEQISLLFNIFKRNDKYICTNGLFVDRYLDEFYDDIKGIIYHVVDFDHFNMIDDNKLQYDVIVTKQNISKVIDFCKKYKGVNLKLCHLRTLDPKLLLDSHDINLLKNNDLLRDYIPCEYSLYLKLLEKCCKNPILKAIDLTKDRIMHCCTRYSNISTWKISSLTLKFLKDGKLFKKLHPSSCFNCSIVYKFKDQILNRDSYEDNKNRV